MNNRFTRRQYLGASSGIVATSLAGCTGSEETGDDEPSDTNSNDPGSSDDGSGSEPKYDGVIDYTTHVQSTASGNYGLPEPQHDDWDWIVVDFEVVEGQLDMEDVWFHGLTETEERYYTVSKNTDLVKNGVESRGAIRQGNRGIMLHAYPPSPASDVVGPMFSATRTAIGGDGVGADGPSDLYPPVSVEYSVETAQDPDVLPVEYAASGDQTWAVVTLDVTEGVLNLEDVWFRSQLTTDTRLYDCDFDSQFADRGVRSRGLVKAGYSAIALYQIPVSESVEGWGYSESGRQDVSIPRA